MIEVKTGTRLVGENRWQGICTIIARPPHWLFDLDPANVRAVFRGLIDPAVGSSWHTKLKRRLELDVAMWGSENTKAKALESADRFASLISSDEKFLQDIASRASQAGDSHGWAISIPKPLANVLFNRIKHLEMRLAQSRLRG